MIAGTPAITMTLAIQKPGAFDILFSISLGAMRNARHPAARFVQIPRLDSLKQKFYRTRIFRNFDTERGGHRAGGDVVMRRADAPGREEIIITRTQRIDRRDNLGRGIRNDADLAQIDADLGQVIRDIIDVLVLGAPGKDLVADDEERRRHGCSLRHGRSPRRMLA